MPDILKVEWIINPLTAPRPVLGCSGCKAKQPFRSSGKIRLNANGKALDGWLIYKCVRCDQTWNRPILRRKNIHEIDPATVLALQDSGADFVQSLEFDLPGLYQATRTVQQFADFSVRKIVRSGQDHPVLQVEITFTLMLQPAVRLERLLAAELGISRSQIRALAATRQLCLSGGDAKALQRPPKHGSWVRIDLQALERGDIIASGAMR